MLSSQGPGCPTGTPQRRPLANRGRRRRSGRRRTQILQIELIHVVEDLGECLDCRSQPGGRHNVWRVVAGVIVNALVMEVERRRIELHGAQFTWRSAGCELRRDAETLEGAADNLGETLAAVDAPP